MFYTINAITKKRKKVNLKVLRTWSGPHPKKKNRKREEKWVTQDAVGRAKTESATQWHSHEPLSQDYLLTQ